MLLNFVLCIPTAAWYSELVKMTHQKTFSNMVSPLTTAKTPRHRSLLKGQSSPAVAPTFFSEAKDSGEMVTVVRSQRARATLPSLEKTWVSFLLTHRST